MKKNILTKSIQLFAVALMMAFSACNDDDDDNLPVVQPQSQLLGAQVIAQGFTSPVTLVEAPDSSKRLFVVDQI